LPRPVAQRPRKRAAEPACAAFNWAYAMFEIPGGYLGDWIGPRKVLMRIVLWIHV
jgi:hypothetical protein